MKADLIRSVKLRRPSEARGTGTTADNVEPSGARGACTTITLNYFTNDAYLGRVLELEQSYSQDEVTLLSRLLKPADTFIDVGANIGAIALPLAHSCARVVAFEPQPELFDLLSRNVTENNLTNVELHQLALAERPGRGTIPLLSELGHFNYGNVTLWPGASQAVEIATLDDALGTAQCDLIKIDVEGFETAVLQGSHVTIDRCRPLIYAEDHIQDMSVPLIRELRSLRYRCWRHRPRMTSGACNVIDYRGIELDNIVSVNILCIPEEKVTQYLDVVSDLEIVVPESPRLGKSGWAGVARLGGMGDNLIAASVLRPLRKAGYKIDVITCEPNHVVFENNPHIDKLSIKDPKDMPQDHREWQKWFRSRGNEYDKFANLSQTCEISLALTQNQTMWQWPSKMRRKYYGHNYLEFVHDVLDVPYDFGPLFFPTDEEREQAIATREKYCDGARVVGWALNGSRVDKTYSKTPMVIARLIRELGVHVMAFGAPRPQDQQMATQIQEYLRHQNGTDLGYHLALSPDVSKPIWPIRRCLTQLQHCDVVIGPDTGQMWAVAFEPVPKIMLHSHASVTNIVKHWVNTISMTPNATVVPCWPCHLLHDDVTTCLDEQRRHGMKPDVEEKGSACILTLSVEDIVQATKLALNTTM